MNGNQILFQDQTGVEGNSEEFDQFGASLAAEDFDGDGFDDVAIGVPGEDIGNSGTKDDAGAINVVDGSNEGINTDTDQILFQDQQGVQGTSESFDNFGATLAAGDFNGDSLSDLAIGVPFEDIGDAFDAGAVNVLDGSANGLDAANSQIWFQDQPGVQGTSESGDIFGRSLAAGDFDNDGFEDLAVGVSDEEIKGIFGAGAVNVFGGSDTGLTADNNQIWFQDQPGVQGTSESGDFFGDSLTSGDFDGDGFDDLAVGAAFEDIKGNSSAGAVNVFAGSDDGLTADNNQIWFQDQPGVQGTSEEFDRFGTSLTSGDFDGDGFDDLAVGAPDEDIKSIFDAGAVNIFGGSDTGLTADNSQIWFQDQPGVEGTSEGFDRFGRNLAAGDFNGDGFDDLAVGVSGEDIKGIVSAGAVNVFNGSDTGLTSDRNQILFQDQPGIQGTSEEFDQYSNDLGFFNEGLSVGDFNNDGFDDLAVGILGEDIGNIVNAGAANIIFGSADGLTA